MMYVKTGTKLKYVYTPIIGLVLLLVSIEGFGRGVKHRRNHTSGTTSIGTSDNSKVASASTTRKKRRRSNRRAASPTNSTTTPPNTNSPVEPSANPPSTSIVPSNPNSSVGIVVPVPLPASMVIDSGPNLPLPSTSEPREPSSISANTPEVGLNNSNFNLSGLSLPAMANNILKSSCSGCHNSELALGGIGSLEVAKNLIELGLIIPKNSSGSPLIQSILTNRMPLGLSGGMDATSKQILSEWVDGGALEFPKNNNQSTPALAAVTGTVEALELIYQDLQKIDPSERPNTRYAILTHVPNSETIPKDQKILFRQSLSKALNSVHFLPQLPIPENVQANDTILRLKIREYSIGPINWKDITSEYPFESQLKISPRWNDLKNQTKASIPVVRADWLTRRVLQSQMYKSLLGLPDNLEELEKSEFLEVNVEENIRNQNTTRIGIAKSGVSFSNRVIERHNGKYGAYYKSYDFESSDDKQNIFQNPLGPVLDNFGQDKGFEHNGGEMIFTLPNGLHGYILTNNAGTYLDDAPTTIVQDPTRRDRIINNSTSCFTCHTVGIIPATDDLRKSSSSGRFKRSFSSKQLQLINGLYPKKEVMDGLIKQDIEKYTETIKKLGIGIEREPVSTVILYYDKDLDLKTIASELQISSSEIESLISKNSTLRSLITTSSNRKRTIGITREKFESNFDTIFSIVNGN